MLRRLLTRLRTRGSATGDPARLTLYSRPECPLCEVMRAEAERARLSRPVDWEFVNIESDPALEARFGRSIPVLEIEGRVAFKGRLTAAELERKFERRVREATVGGRA